MHYEYLSYWWMLIYKFASSNIKDVNAWNESYGKEMSFYYEKTFVIFYSI